MLCLCEFTIIVLGQCIGGNAMKFELLADSIKQINDKASSAAKSAVNQLMTLRNWAIGSTVSSEFKLPDFGKSSTVSNEFVTDPDVLVNNLSFSHIREIMVLNDAFERFFTKQSV